MRKVDKILKALAFLNTIRACGYDVLTSTATNACQGPDAGLTCFAFSFSSFDDFNTFKADFATAETATNLFFQLGLILECAESAQSLNDQISEGGMTLTTPIEVTDEVLAEINGQTCSAEGTGCWEENFDCY